MTTWTWVSFPQLGTFALYDLLALRQRVFVVEQRCAFLDADGRDRAAWHLQAHRDGVLVAGLRAFPPGVEHADAVIGRVAVHPDHRGRGYGKSVMTEGLSLVRSTWGDVAVHAGCQAYLERFYGELGFEVVGPGYDEDGIPHLPMRRPPARQT